MSGGQFGVAGGGVADEVAKVVDEVGLVCVAEVEGELGSVEGLAGVEALDELVQAIATDDPFGWDADVLAEEPLEGAGAHAGAGGELVDGEDRWLVEDELDELGAEVG